MSSETESTPFDAGRVKAPADDDLEQIIRALKHNDDKAPVLKPYLLAARWISPAIHPYANLTSVFFTGLEEDGTEDNEDASQGSEIDKAEEVKIFQAIMKLHPSFEDVVLACVGHKRALQNFIHMLENKSRSARNSDLSLINSSICEFVKEDSDRVMYNEEEFPMPAKTNVKDRGWNHPLFAILLYPMCRHDNLHVDPEELLQIMVDADNADIDISECEWPAYLYPSDTSPDVEDDRKGLFRGNLLPIAFRNSFTSPQSALDRYSTAKGRSSKARLHNLTTVTGRTIAYVCVLVRIALRGSGWVADDGAFEYEVFYQNIVRMFEEVPDDPWVIDTLEWWNEQIPGLPKSTAGGKKTKKMAVGPDGRIRDPVARSAAQRAAKEGKARESAAAAFMSTDANPVQPTRASTATATANSEPLQASPTAAVGQSSIVATQPLQGSATGKTPPISMPQASPAYKPTPAAIVGDPDESDDLNEPSYDVDMEETGIRPAALPPAPVMKPQAVTQTAAKVVLKHGRKVIASDSELSDPPESENELEKPSAKAKKRKGKTAPTTAVKRLRSSTKA